jgi:hypothetical protein
MPKYAYDRLSAQDNNFLLWERGNVRMHIASTMVCDAGPLKQKDGGIDVDTFKRATEAFLHLVPRYAGVAGAGREGGRSVAGGRAAPGPSGSRRGGARGSGAASACQRQRHGGDEVA